MYYTCYMYNACITLGYISHIVMGLSYSKEYQHVKNNTHCISAFCCGDNSVCVGQSGSQETNSVGFNTGNLRTEP